MTNDEESTLWQQAKSRDAVQAEFAKRRLIESKLLLVVTTAERYATDRTPILDLIQEGNKGLVVALTTFGEDSKADFSAHAAACVESAIVKAAAGSDSQ